MKTLATSESQLVSFAGVNQGVTTNDFDGLTNWAGS